MHGFNISSVVEPGLDLQNLAKPGCFNVTLEGVLNRQSQDYIRGKKNARNVNSENSLPRCWRLRDLKADTELRDIMTTGNSCHHKDWSTKRRGWF